MKLILSLFDYSGNWSKPYRDAGYNVIQVDIKLGLDIMTWDYRHLSDVYGILAAVPCTDFSSSGAVWWAEKDQDGRTARSLQLVDRTLEIIKYFEPVFWVIENPVGRLWKMRPELGKPWYFNPCDFGDPYTKKTGLVGRFVPPLPLFVGKNLAVEPIVTPSGHHSTDVYMMEFQGMENRSFGERKEWRSITPPGFARAFYEANK